MCAFGLACSQCLVVFMVYARRCRRRGFSLLRSKMRQTLHKRQPRVGKLKAPENRGALVSKWHFPKVAKRAKRVKSTQL